MAKAAAIVEGLQIFLKYNPEVEAEASQDELQVLGSQPDAFTAEDRTALEALGWNFDDTFSVWGLFT